MPPALREAADSFEWAIATTLLRSEAFVNPV